MNTTPLIKSLALLVLATASTQPLSGLAQNTAFTFQSRLLDSGQPANGLYEVRFAIYDSTNTPGTLIAGPITNAATSVSNGLFCAALDFGLGVFTGPGRWLQIDVRTNGSPGPFTSLSPRQALTPVPYALMATSASNLLGTLAAGQLSGAIPASQLSGTAGAATNFTGTLNGDVTGTQGATVVTSVGGQTAANVASGAVAANGATSANTANALLKRDSSGNFSAGTISANLSGNATSATSATTATTATTASTANNFSGALAGDVTGTQGATVVALVGGQSATTVAAGASAANAATSAATPNALVARDASAGFSSSNLTLLGNVYLPTTRWDGSAGIVYAGTNSFLHTYAAYANSYNLFVGPGAGNFTLTTAACDMGVGYGALHSLTTGYDNTAAGYQALAADTSGSYNTASGYGALQFNTTGAYNTADGAYALNTNNGTYNTASGYGALTHNTTGNRDTALGAVALQFNTTGNDNLAVGYEALYFNTNGGNNTALGSYALYGNQNGNGNTATGWEALYSNVSGYGNTAVGTTALYGNTNSIDNTAVGNGALAGQAGANNTAIGYNALAGSVGNNNTALGTLAGQYVAAGNNNIHIGNSGGSGDSGVIKIGTQGTQAGGTFIAGISGATSSGGAAVYVNSSGQLGTLTSSARFKEAIQSMGASSDSVLALHPVTFRYKPEIDAKGLPQFGLVAEEVEKVNPELVIHDEAGKPYTVRYEAVNAMLLNEFLKEHRKVEDMEKRLNKLEQLLEAKLGAAK